MRPRTLLIPLLLLLTHAHPLSALPPPQPASTQPNLHNLLPLLPLHARAALRPLGPRVPPVAPADVPAQPFTLHEQHARPASSRRHVLRKLLARGRRRALGPVLGPMPQGRDGGVGVRTLVDGGVGHGLTLQPCRVSAECRWPRRCEELSSPEECRDGSEGCLCFPVDRAFLDCDCENPCVHGEVCEVVRTGASFCVRSESAEAVLDCGGDVIFSPPVKVTFSPPPTPTPTPVETGGGLTLDACMNDEDCQGPRECLAVNERGTSFVLCPAFLGCVCVPTDLDVLMCDCDDPCGSGERCVVALGDVSVCVSKAVPIGEELECEGPSPSPTPIEELEDAWTGTWEEPVFQPPDEPRIVV